MEKEKKEVKLIPHEGIIDLKMSGFFYSRILKLSENFIKAHSQEEIQNALTQIKDKDIKEDWVFDLETLLILNNDCEKLFKDTNQIQTQELEEYVKNES
ncbi:MAG: hypothetical protein EOL97_08525 [Spirochaetia bacterium]|nr:hypothetical protein [Spirochaetia bacterium]